jgi:hypothetical protein
MAKKYSRPSLKRIRCHIPPSRDWCGPPLMMRFLTFGVSRYLAEHPEITASGTEPLTHYVLSKANDTVSARLLSSEYE